MAVLIERTSATDAWVEAAKFLCEHRETVGLHVHIKSPLALEPTTVAALDARLGAAKRIPCKDVAYTIFPQHLWEKQRPKQPDLLFQRYNRAGGTYDRLQRRRRKTRHNDWGTYFQRLSSPEVTGGASQLSKALAALAWNRKPRGAIHLHTGLATDSFRPLGGPCLQCVTLHVEATTPASLHACVLYRNQDFFEKALGNYIGLGHLLAFLAECSGLKIGTLQVVSGHAYCSAYPPVRSALAQCNG